MTVARHPLENEETRDNVYNLSHPKPRRGLAPVHYERDDNLREYHYDMRNPTPWTILYRQLLAAKQR